MEFSDLSAHADNAPSSSVTTMKFKKFIKAKTNESNINNENTPTTSSSCGEEVQEFYLNVTNNNRLNRCNESDEEITICQELKKRKFSNSEYEHRDLVDSNVNKAMKYAECDDVNNLRRLINKGVNVNATDNFGWSLLMVASCAGSVNVVKYLLEINARKGSRDVHGNTAIYLASKNGNKQIVSLLTKQENICDSKNSAVDTIHLNNKSDATSTSYYCKECNVTSQCSKKVHETSIVHLFKVGSVKEGTAYEIPRSNIGFQMLLNQGWDDSQGLGPSGSGIKYPLKVKKKNNRVGVGHIINSNQVERVEKERCLSVKTLNKNISVDKEREKNFRRLLNDPDF